MVQILEHPAITKVNRTGYLHPEPKHYGFDFFGNEVMVGDEILVLDDEFFLKEEMFDETIQVLKLAGAVEIIAE
jgi:hypothetical protein